MSWAPNIPGLYPSGVGNPTGTSSAPADHKLTAMDKVSIHLKTLEYSNDKEIDKNDLRSMMKSSTDSVLQAAIRYITEIDDTLFEKLDTMKVNKNGKIVEGKKAKKDGKISVGAFMAYTKKLEREYRIENGLFKPSVGVSPQNLFTPKSISDASLLGMG